jgi:peroxiredoxin
MSALEVGQPARDLVLLGEGDRERSLAELAGGRPLVLVFLRHFG